MLWYPAVHLTSRLNFWDLSHAFGMHSKGIAMRVLHPRRRSATSLHILEHASVSSSTHSLSLMSTSEEVAVTAIAPRVIDVACDVRSRLDPDHMRDRNSQKPWPATAIEICPL